MIELASFNSFSSRVTSMAFVAKFIAPLPTISAVAPLISIA